MTQVTQKRYLVTGGAGFIGSHVTEHMLGLGHAVTVLDNFATGKRENLDQVRVAVGAEAASRLRVVEGCITNAGDVAGACEGVHGIVHLAALPSVVRSVEEPVESHHFNVTGTVQVLDAARQRGLKVVYAGSSSAYGDQDTDFKHEGLREDPLSPYASSKLASELYCRSFARVYGTPIVVTRFFNVFGPRQVPDSPYSGVVAAFCFALLQGRAPRIDGDGSQSRDFTYVQDVARGVTMALEAETAGCQTVNLACAGNHTVKSLFEILRSQAGVDVEPVYATPRTGDVMHSRAAIDRIRDLIGFEPEVSFEEGLARTYDWYRSTFV
jgi:nucleoside-diphosphate-sugar epimerase